MKSYGGSTGTQAETVIVRCFAQIQVLPEENATERTKAIGLGLLSEHRFGSAVQNSNFNGISSSRSMLRGDSEATNA